MASRVLPVPPGPVSVSRRLCPSSAVISASSCSRPMKLVGGVPAHATGETAAVHPDANAGRLQAVGQRQHARPVGARVAQENVRFDGARLLDHGLLAFAASVHAWLSAVKSEPRRQALSSM